ncbi:MAG TPA: hypothetical protein VFU00_13635 [Gemmatimonadales bacterium]|nr:hypothetical protein [Gemmatimonadales bacterium]
MTRRGRGIGLAVAVLALMTAEDAGAQGYRLRLDSRMQTASFRGVSPDSIAESETVTGEDGGLYTPDGFAVSCDPAGRCRYFRPGPVVDAAPFMQQADLSLWGFGIAGLSVRANARLVADLAESDAWPGTEPTVQLLEGYAEYARRAFTARAGRQVLTSRLGFTGFDGGRLVARAVSLGLEGEIYGGWGLARATALPVTSAALNPLDEYRPAERTIVVGAAAGATTSRGSVRLDYQREVDPRSDYFVSERVAFSLEARPREGWSVAGGAEYDLAAGFWGSADLQLRYARPLFDVTAAARHYRPHFDLWTIWGAFSPVPYNALSGTARVRPIPRLELRGRGEVYGFEAAEATTPLFDAEEDGWRASGGATVTLGRGVSADLDIHGEFGPGAASRGIEGGLRYAADERMALAVRGARLERPLEFRFNEAKVNMLALDGEWRATERFRVAAGVSRFWEDRERPDAGAFDWAQTRVFVRLTALVGRDAGTQPLPPGRRRPRLESSR